MLTSSELVEEEKEQKAAHNKRQKKYYAKRTPEQKAADNQYQKEYQSKRTPEQKAAYNKRQKKYYAKLTPEQKAACIKRQKECRAKWTPEQKAAYNQYQKKYWEETRNKKIVTSFIKDNLLNSNLVESEDKIINEALIYYKNLPTKEKAEFVETLKCITLDKLNDVQKKEKLIYLSKMVDKDLEITEEELERH